MELEEIRRQWKRTRVVADGHTDYRRAMETAARSRAKGALGKLARQYRLQALFALALPVLSPLLVSDFRFPLWLATLYALYGIVMAAVNMLFYRHLSGLDIMSQPVVTALSISADILRRQRNIILGSLTCALVLIGLLLWQFHSIGNTWLLVGAWAGTAVGAAVGIVKVMNKTRLARQIRNELKSTI